MPNLNINLNRNTLSKFLPNPESIRAFENLFDTVSIGLPTTIEEVQSLAEQAQAGTVLALALLSKAQKAIDMLSAAPVPPTAVEADDHAPRVHLGTMSTQNHDAVAITGGTANFNTGSVGAPSLTFGGDAGTGFYRIGPDNLGLSIAGVKLGDFSSSAGAFTQNLSTTKQLVSTIATGTPPLVVSSATLVPNLYADRAGQADGLNNPSTYPAPATDLPTVITLANALRSAAIARGL